jgi:general nucleoside transport system permease protein
VNPGSTPALGETEEVAGIAEPDPASASLVELPEVHAGTAQGPLDALVPTPQGFDLTRAGRGLVRWVASLAGAVAIFAVFLWAKGADPWDALHAMWDSAAGDSGSIGETLVRATPLLLAALAVAVPARAGLFNIGGEGQLLLGAIGGTGTAYALEGRLPSIVLIPAICLGGMVFGAIWAAIPVVLKLLTSTNEAITSLLMNYVAGFALTWLVFEPWKDPTSLGQAYSREFEPAAQLPTMWGDRVHAGILVALGAAVAVWLALTFTRWGFRLRVLGGNAEAARRAGMPVAALALSAVLVGGALAGLGGAVEVSGVETRLRPDLLVNFGYIGFLASWLARHHPLKAIVASGLLGGIAVGGFGLRIATGLSAAAVTMLMALVLLAVLGFARPRRVTA